MGRERRVADRAVRFEGCTPSSALASAAKRAIRRTDTRAEVALRRALWALGLRYRKNLAALPGRPDIVFTRARVAVFVDGDFWHGRDWRRRVTKLGRGANAPYWLAKIAANRQRDQRKTRELETACWKVVRLWETDVLLDPRGAAEHVAAIVSSGTSGMSLRFGDRPAAEGRLLHRSRKRSLA